MVYFAEMRLFLWEPFLCRDKEVICPLSTTGSPRPFTVIIVIVIIIIIITSIVIIVTAVNNLSPSLPVMLVEQIQNFKWTKLRKILACFAKCWPKCCCSKRSKALKGHGDALHNSKLKSDENSSELVDNDVMFQYIFSNIQKCKIAFCQKKKKVKMGSSLELRIKDILCK